ncbi:hypothetical protein ACFUN8_14105 [Streptomyces sp. NPDC057307]|uniref:hypothetical protein n=1 Tax=Streptomyces sp. NPDC057307 TaxID=3346096 RepID=UPI00363B6AAA
MVAERAATGEQADAAPADEDPSAEEDPAEETSAEDTELAVGDGFRQPEADRTGSVK